jgi:spore germination protein KB
MEKQSYVSSRQIISVLIVTRLLFSTAYVTGLEAGTSVQDVLLAVPVNFIVNFIVAIPVLVLLGKNPGKDLTECASNSIGKAAGAVVGIFYMLVFLLIAVFTQATFQIYFVNSVIPNSHFLAIAIPMAVVCLYGAVKGIESISRFGGYVMITYAVILGVIFISLIPSINLGYLFPLLYNGPQIALKAFVSGFNSSMQILFLAFCAPYLRSGTNLTKLYAKWNVIAMLMFLFLEFLMVVVMGPFGAKQNFPLQMLATQSEIGVFERLDAVDMTSWILNTTLNTTFYIYLAVMCLTKMGLNGRRRLVTVIVVVIVFVATQFVSTNYDLLHKVTFTTPITILSIFAMLVVPLVLLIADAVKRRVADEAAQ